MILWRQGNPQSKTGSKSSQVTSCICRSNTSRICTSKCSGTYCVEGNRDRHIFSGKARGLSKQRSVIICRGKRLWQFGAMPLTKDTPLAFTILWRICERSWSWHKLILLYEVHFCGQVFVHNDPTVAGLEKLLHLNHPLTKFVPRRCSSTATPI